MGRHSHGVFTPLQRHAIVMKKNLGIPMKEIARSLNRDPQSVADCWRNFRNRESYERKKRKKTEVLLLSDSILRHLCILYKKQSLGTLSDGVNYLANFYGINCGKTTVLRGLKKKNIRAQRKIKKPLISKVNRKKRVEFARKYRHWTVEDWKNVIFTDETRVKLINSDGVSYVWEGEETSRLESLDPKCLKPTVKNCGGWVHALGEYVLGRYGVFM